ncbi:hypothetical protein FBEOM_10805 [Fusarium beomiforme]|uniref:Uncharacterized protein n=1 Tax=Fusarium beomiforme TaxID=44412 RepID=A0A9P5AAN4_9HYPO|nr:hypothetical protein FBEOM_10805 [Fusarium beomiforme]
MLEIPLPDHALKRQITSSSNNEVTVTLAPDETCGWLSGRPGVPITTQESAAYCRTYAYPDGIQDYRCVPTPETRVSSVSFTYKGQKNAGLVTATYTNAPSEIVSTEFVYSTTSSSPSTSSLPSSAPAPPSPSHNNNIAAIVGGAIGGFVALSLIFLAIFWFIRRSKEDGSPPAEKLHSPSQAAPMVQTDLTGTPSFNLNAGNLGSGSSAQSEWRSSMMTFPCSAGNSTSPQGWMNQPGSPGTQSATSQGIPQAVPYEMSGDSIQTESHGVIGDPTRSRVYEMVGDAPHSWI